MGDKLVTDYIVSKAEESNVTVDTIAPNNNYIEIVPANPEENTEYRYEEFLESLPISLRMSISFDINTVKFEHFHSLELYLTQTDLDKNESVDVGFYSDDRVELETTPIEQMYEYIRGLIKDVQALTDDRDSGTTIPTLQWTSEDTFTVEQNIENTALPIGNITYESGNYEYCSSLSINEETNTITYKFKSPFSIARNNSDEKVGEHLKVQNNRTELVWHHTLKCPHCLENSVRKTLLQLTKSRVHGKVSRTVLNCVNCNYTTVVDNYTNLFTDLHYHTLREFSQNVLIQQEVLETYSGNIDIDITSTEDARESYLSDKHRFNHKNSTYCLHYQSSDDFSISPFRSTESDRLTLSEICGPLVKRMFTDDWDNIPEAYETYHTCLHCQKNQLHNERLYQLKQRIVPLTDFTLDENTDSSEYNNVNWVEYTVCEECRDEIKSAFNYGLNKHSLEILVEEI